MSANKPVLIAPRFFSTPSNWAAFVVSASRIARGGIPASTNESICEIVQVPRVSSSAKKIRSLPKASVTPILYARLADQRCGHGNVSQVPPASRKRARLSR